MIHVQEKKRTHNVRADGVKIGDVITSVGPAGQIRKVDGEWPTVLNVHHRVSHQQGRGWVELRTAAQRIPLNTSDAVTLLDSGKG